MSSTAFSLPSPKRLGEPKRESLPDFRGTPRARRRAMPDTRRADLELRAIVVSTRAALRQISDPEDLARLKATSNELLTRFEQRVAANGGDPATLAAIEEARASLWG